jgi:signal transduction histidine kinase
MLFIGFCFAVFGFFVWAHNPHDRTVVLFVGITHSVAALQVVGWLTALCRPWAFLALNLCLGLSAAVAIHFHLVFPRPRNWASNRWRLAPFYALALAIPLLYLPGLSAGHDAYWYRLSLNAARLYSGAAVLTVAILLLHAYRTPSSPLDRQRIRLVLFGTVLGAAPAVGLSMLPEAFDPERGFFVPYEITLPFLLLIPLAYGVAIHRHDLLRVDRLVNRGVVHVSLLLLLAFAYLALAASLPHLLPGSWTEHPSTWGILALAIAWLFMPLRNRLQTLADRTFYGGWYDYRSLVSETTQALAGIVRADKLATVLVEQLTDRLHLRGAALLLPAPEEHHLVIERSRWPADTLPPSRLTMSGPLGRELVRASQPVTTSELRAALAATPLSSEETAWITQPEVEMWVPLVGRGTLQGALLLGAKAGQEPFDPEDRRLLSTLAWGAAVAAENAQLVSELQRRADEVNRLYSQLVQSREAERKRLARELHDRVIQDLINLPYAVGTDLPAAEGERLRRHLRGIIDSLREVCAELRPSALDDLSLSLAVQGHVEEVRAQYGLDLSLRLPEDDSLEALPEEARLCLFRVLQEALTNVHRHARARKAAVELLADADRVTLEVRDDGQGFPHPPNLGTLIRAGHFGLAGAQERLGALGGTLQIEFERGRGTTLRASVPLAPRGEAEPRASDPPAP